VRSGYTALVLRMLENGANPNALDEVTVNSCHKEDALLDNVGI